jgi:uncharacterized membrane protein
MITAVEWTRRPHRQRGAAALFAGVTMVAFVSVVMLGIELGRIYSVKRALQSATALAALDAVRVVGGCTTADAPTASSVEARIRDTLSRNQQIPESLLGEGSQILFGQERTEDGLRVLDTSVPFDEANAVGVRLIRSMPTPLFPVLSSGDGVIRSAAYATQTVVGQISVGTSLLNLDTADSALANQLLGELLGTSALTLSVASYEGLVRSTVDLLDLAALSVGSVDTASLLSLSLSAAEALDLMATVVNDDGNLTVAATLSSLAGSASRSTTFPLGDILRVEEGLESGAEGLPVNVMDLVMALAQAGARGQLINLPLNVSIPGLATAAVQLSIVEPPQIAIGRPGFFSDGTPRTQARSAQVRLQLNVELASVFPGGGLVNLPVVVEGASSHATLVSVRCANRLRPQPETTVEVDTALARVGIGRYSNLLSNDNVIAPLPLVNLAGLITVIMPNPVVVDVGEAAVDAVDFTGPFVPAVSEPAADHHQTVGLDNASLLESALDELGPLMADELQFGGLLGGPLNSLGLSGLLALVVDLLAPVVDLVDAVLGSLLDQLGLRLGNSEIQMQTLEPTPPYLFAKDG